MASYINNICKFLALIYKFLNKIIYTLKKDPNKKSAQKT